MILFVLNYYNDLVFIYHINVINLFKIVLVFWIIKIKMKV